MGKQRMPFAHESQWSCSYLHGGEFRRWVPSGKGRFFHSERVLTPEPAQGDAQVSMYTRQCGGIRVPIVGYDPETHDDAREMYPQYTPKHRKPARAPPPPFPGAFRLDKPPPVHPAAPH